LSYGHISSALDVIDSKTYGSHQIYLTPSIGTQYCVYLAIQWHKYEEIKQQLVEIGRDLLIGLKDLNETMQFPWFNFTP